ncbi:MULTISPECIES: NAD-dependent succinate-semialdehyde dehydrogenase [Bradyrhizobium]|uniref:NAD-dependent succinate-semialdehyde dehydrogenase n=1 Tax=Bradyrhizobium TaxID=374 RepID=UPI000231D2A0|nr:NAD-dependent succinate-semialdehyde dehydrogenase [Bradyrhizobium japonicum]AJA64003.1 aldehyde dehydrogenase [Bradyrhizobium japonicum]KMJ95950.1 aldehyde dehydrogenase [Bradyrhizobium japonicum]MBR0727782.1 NAD-dependent succinate-semialdehyde dehydrogenase [Bradyrhizobium japonicum]MBR0803334.1 NAD-dependent succinate-semialdehyde dehydrogenase [Bradyrhizobium japonicum]MCP1767067.1 succinate-semialdehyde dehydrogenase/glutarate-semialdehyde dehydrogenase [Bradyrhizobium japonicum]
MAEYPLIELYIDGQWKRASGQPIINPADESVLGTVPTATKADLDDALAAAEKGFAIWRSTAPAKRAQIILKAAALIRERVDVMAAAMTLEQGKPIEQAKLEILRGCDIIEWDATEGLRLYGRVIPSEPGMRHTVLRQPIGPVAAFSPWNFPMSSPARKVAGALSAGCSIILKASEETPAGAFQLVRAFHDVGLPAGVLNLVFGNPAEISEYLIPQSRIRLVTFTGSIPVGKHLAEMAGRYMKPAIMELGGHAPVIVCDDVDPVATGAASAIGKSRNAGQVCVAPTRFFVQESIYEQFAQSFAERASQLKVGNGLDPSTQLGPLANSRRIDAMETLVADAKAKGARVLAGGQRIGNRGYFFPLTVLADLPDDARAMNEEPFGPLALVNPVKTLDEAIEKANALPFGLAAYAFTKSASNAERLAESVEVGNLSINHFVASVAETPFGGVKDSGYGREGGTEGLQCYTVVKNVSHKTL